MKCLHPHCPMGTGAKDWNEVVTAPEVGATNAVQRGELLNNLVKWFGAPSATPAKLPPPTSNQALFGRLLLACPCLFNQVDIEPTPQSIVHLCEITLGARISSSNAYDAFNIQHPRGPTFKFPPATGCRDGGGIMEMLCSEVLETSGIPRMHTGADGWPTWTMPGHILLNRGRMSTLKALGDLLVPCAPTNIIISVKSEVARERLLYSANSIEGVGFGFFKEPQEFWTSSRMRLFKRMGFSAIYLPDHTHAAIMERLAKRKEEALAVNINGTQLYRPLTIFGSDMQRIVGRSTFDL